MHEITVNIELADLKAFQAHARKNSPALRRTRWSTMALYLLLSLYFAWTAMATDFFERIIVFCISFALMLVFYSVLTFVFRHSVEFRAFKNLEKHGVLGEHTIVLNEEGVEERTSVNESKAKWAGLFRVEATEDHILIYPQPYQAHVIPLRAFANRAQGQAFLQFAQERFAAAKGETGGSPGQHP